MHEIVTAPLIAAKLSRVIKVAYELSISALNAKIITARSGAEGRALRPLTDHITEHTREMLDIVREITHHSVDFSSSSIQAGRLEKSLESFQRAYQLHGKKHSILEERIEGITQNLKQQQDQLHEMEKKLTRMLNHLGDINRTFRFISINCDIESSQVPAIQSDFAVVSTVLKDAGDFINKTLKECFELLKNKKEA